MKESSTNTVPSYETSEPRAVWKTMMLGIFKGYVEGVNCIIEGEQK